MPSCVSIDLKNFIVLCLWSHQNI